MGFPPFQFKQFVIEQETVAHPVGTDGVLLGAWADVNGARRVLDVGRHEADNEWGSSFGVRPINSYVLAAQLFAFFQNTFMDTLGQSLGAGVI